MGMRFRKSVKICKGVKVNFSKSGASLSLGGKGHSVNVGGRKGTRATVGIPGTGISYSTKVGGSSKKKSSSSRRKTYSKPATTPPKEITLRMNDKGQITITDGKGNEIYDQAIIRKIKATPQFKEQKARLELQRQAKIEEMIYEAEEANRQFINIYRLSPCVEREKEFFDRLNDIVLKEYSVDSYTVPMPDEKELREELYAEAKGTIRASIFKVGKLRKQYVEENLDQRLKNAIATWEKDKKTFDANQADIKKEKDKDFYSDYITQKKRMQSLIDGDDEMLCETFDAWIDSCELPVEMNINYEWDQDKGVLLLDVDLPEIEDLPNTFMTKSAAGNLTEKKKKQADLRKEYATLVFGLAVFISTNAFNISPAIKRILISGYTQRRDRDGNINDDYIYSIKFNRESFEGRNLSVTPPQDFCMTFENRCKMTATSLFKTIKPFEILE